MFKITEQHTFDAFMGSGALSLPWYTDVHFNGLESEGWRVAFVELDDAMEPGPVLVFDHEMIMKAVVACASRWIIQQFPDDPESVASRTTRECCLFLADPDAADFDAHAADEVMQFAAFGTVAYG